MQFFITFIIAYISGIVASLFFIDNYRTYRLIKAHTRVTRSVPYAQLKACIDNILAGKANSFDIHPNEGEAQITTRVIVTEIPPLKTADSTQEVAQ